MFGTREELCHELERMFTPDEPLLLLVWTPGSVEAACDPEEERVSDEELPALMAALGDIPMDTYQEAGLTREDVRRLLRSMRVASRRQVTVPAALLNRVIDWAVREVTARESQCFEAGQPVPCSVALLGEDLRTLKARAA
ncbi:DUF1380 family protein [Mangrovibacter phragmitis]|uniref:DUF1380 family protein n=1 Tax=Mangrovibacter phragmitis TaxID=1691903 RepID=UPI003369D438